MTLTLELPVEVFSSLRRSPDEFGREMRRAAAIYWYQRGQISQEKAAQVAGLDRTDFLMALAREGVDALSWTSTTYSASWSVADRPVVNASVAGVLRARSQDILEGSPRRSPKGRKSE